MLKKIYPGRVLIGALLLLLGYGTIYDGIQVLSEWTSVRPAYLMIGLLWTITGTAIFVSGAWLMTCLGSRKVPFGIAGSGVVLSGALVIAGLLTHVVPCSGPD